MELRSARHMDALARHLSFTLAAEELGITQSALSRSIQELERSTQLRLFDRERGGGVRLTAPGHTLMQHVIRLLLTAEDIDHIAAEMAQGRQQKLAFGMGPLPAAALLPVVIPQNTRLFPETQFHVTVRRPDKLLGLLMAEELEFVVCSRNQLNSKSDLDEQFLGHFPISYLVRAGHPLLAANDSGSTEDYPWIMSPTAYTDFDTSKRGLPFLKGRPSVIIEDFGCLARLTLASDAIWVSSRFAVMDEIRSGSLRELAAPEISPHSPVEMMIYSLSQRSLSPAALRLRDDLRRAVKNMTTPQHLSSALEQLALEQHG